MRRLNHCFIAISSKNLPKIQNNLCENVKEFTFSYLNLAPPHLLTIWVSELACASVPVYKSNSVCSGKCQNIKTLSWSKSGDAQLDVMMIKSKWSTRGGVTERSVKKARQWNGSWMVWWGEADPLTKTYNITWLQWGGERETGSFTAQTELNSLFTCNSAWNLNVTDTVRS